MPVTFAPVADTCSQDTPPATSRDVAPITAAKLLLSAAAANADPRPHIVRSSVGGRPGPDTTPFKIAPGPGHGFVDTVLCAYTHHHALVIRPDDVWLAVVSQFSFYATAEKNACSFLDSASGKIPALALETSVESDTAQPDVERLSRRITRLLQKTVPDADLRDWLVPEFSTTTLTDATVSCLLFLSGSSSSSAQTRSGSSDADLTFGASSGIPRVTLEGERADWELLSTRLDRLKARCKDFGLPAVAWYHLLHPVLERFVGAFDDPEGAENREFWGSVVFGKEEQAKSNAGGKNKNAEKLSGWITAFCAFSAEGTWLGPELNANATAADAPETLTAAQFWSTYTTRPASASTPAQPKAKAKKPAKGKGNKKTVLLDILEVVESAAPAPTIVLALADVPPASASAALSLSLKIKATAGANGTASPTTTTTTAYTVLAGLVGTGFSSSRDAELSATGRNDTVRPVVAWWIYGRAPTLNGIRKVKTNSTGTGTKDRGRDGGEGSEENIPVVPAPRLADAGVGVGAADTHDPEPEPEPVPEPVSVLPTPTVQQSARSPWSLGSDTGTPPVVVPEPSSSLFDDPDADKDEWGWNTAPAPAPVPAPAPPALSDLGLGLGSGFGFGLGSGGGFGFGGAGTVADPVTEPVTETEPVVASDAPAPAGGSDWLFTDVALEPAATATAETAAEGGEPPAGETQEQEEQTGEKQETEQPTQEQQIEEAPIPAPDPPTVTEDPAVPDADADADAAAAAAADAAAAVVTPAADGEEGGDGGDGEDAAPKAGGGKNNNKGGGGKGGGGGGGKKKKKK
ncbi:hypothetical protein B0H19DRAFT_1145849 [Mycena capillaripes]|nr:hypothetical protein B0H19DRAFT_1145849 [Mycena capillaripes]